MILQAAAKVKFAISGVGRADMLLFVLIAEPAVLRSVGLRLGLGLQFRLYVRCCVRLRLRLRCDDFAAEAVEVGAVLAEVAQRVGPLEDEDRQQEDGSEVGYGQD